VPDLLPLQPIAPAVLASLYLAIEQRRAGPPEQTDDSKPRATVAERLFMLRERLRTTRRLAWDEICGTTVDEIVATLLALLELLRRGEATVVQNDLFGPITLRAAEATPETH
jgi:chromatin segregation and condensation protein Rec8/ScpA/Scc1 (kleisin family)